MKSSSPKRRVRPLRAKASAINAAEFEDYGPEPNMKLSHAFMVVLALHIIAVGGLFAFNKVKASHTSFSVKSKPEHALAKELVSSEVSSTAASSVASTSTVAAVQETAQKVAKTIVSHQQAQAPAPLNAAAPAIQAPATQLPPGVTENPPPTSSAPAVAASTPDATPEPASAVALKEYTIVKGDNPYKVAKKFHVSYDALMKINNITDPRKIQIGQKLKIPAAVISHKAVKHN